MFRVHIPFLAYFPYFEKIKVGLCDHHAVYVSVYPPYQLLNAWKFVTYVMAPESISTAYFINLSYRSVCLCIPLPMLASGSVETLPRQRIYAK
jgi:hypothetical protein